jgi:signal transduction histidine kinase
MNEPPAKTDAHILIVEDVEAQAFKLQHLLANHFSKVSVAANGVEALPLMESDPPALVISDVHMPEMDGCELCRRIKTDTRFGGIPVVLITSLTDPHEAIKGLQCGANGFLTKPYEEGPLLARIQFLLANPDLQAKRCDAPSEAGVEIVFGGKKYFIASERERVLDLLLSTFELAIWKNRELQSATDRLEARTRELERSNRELEQFAAVASHDLQEPLRMVTSYLTLIERRVADRLGEKELSFLRFALDGGKRMQQMIADLLAYSRVGLRRGEAVAVDLNAVLEEALANLGAARAEKNARVSHDVLPTLRVERSRFVQLFQNLVGNALKFSRPGESPEVHVGCGPKEGGWHFAVRDHGIGIAEKDFARIFVLFQRLHSREEYPGTGIGLSVCQKIVEHQGGRIWVESTPGEGTTFHFTLPAA